MKRYEDVFGKDPATLELWRKSLESGWGKLCDQSHKCTGTHCDICSTGGRCYMYRIHTADSPCPDWFKCSDCVRRDNKNRAA